MVLKPWNKSVSARTPLHEIPMGPYCAKIMVNFGDGEKPTPLAVKAVLQMVKSQMQAAVKDARHLRRKLFIEYKKAKFNRDQVRVCLCYYWLSLY